MIEQLGLRQKLTEIFASKLNLKVPSVETDLVENGLLDSLTLVELLSQLEETFGLSIPIDELELENFRSIASIARLVAQRVNLVEAGKKESEYAILG
ncbi:MAG TPA: acyl carrier protein [Blastocatellia bacterium]|nr:acyl carrier protein [Blastocatellia bacterium]